MINKTLRIHIADTHICLNTHILNESQIWDVWSTQSTCAANWFPKLYISFKLGEFF